MRSTRGWHGQPARHALAAKGISSRYNEARIERVATRGVGTAFGRRTAYAGLLKKLAKGYSQPPSDVSEDDYDRAVDPLFISLAETDEFVAQGDLKNAKERLTMALDEYAMMERLFPVINDTDSATFRSATSDLTAGLLSANREALVPVNPNAKAEAPPYEQPR